MNRRALFLALTVSALIGALPGAATAHADCSLPVCDMKKSLADFKAMGQQQRYQTILGHLATANRTTDADVLNNLIAFGDGAKQVLIETQDENWMVNAAINLSVTCTARLAKYSPLQTETLMTFFQKLPYEASRYEVLLYWQQKAKDYEDKAQLLELSRYFSQAKHYCEQQEDDEYVIQVAKDAEKSVNTKIFRLQPIYEGVFSAQVRCADGGTACPSAQIDRMVVMDDLSGESLYVSFVISRLGISLHAFADVKLMNGGLTLEGIARVSGNNSLAKVHLDYDLATRDVTGTIETTDETMTVTARNGMPLTPIEIFDRQVAAGPDAPAIPNAAFDKTFSGLFGGQRATLKINVFEDEKEDKVGATLTLSNVPNYKVRFQAGRFFPRRGILVLTGQPAINGGVMKLVLGVNAAQSGQLSISGISFSTLNGNVNTVQMVQP